MIMIRIQNLSKSFDGRPVLDGVTLEIPRGAVTAVLGPNASGKSTLIKCILGLVNPDEGRILLDGEPVVGEWRYRSRIGYMPQIARFPDNLSVEELFEMLKSIRDRHEDLDIELYARYDLGAIAKQRLGTLSGGTRQKINAAIACLFAPQLVVLDEPTVGLDPLSATVLKDKVKKERDNGRTVLLTSHLLGEVGELADHIVYLLEGRPAYTGTIDDLRRRTSEERVERAIVRIMEESDETRRQGVPLRVQ
jgi:Cu-processing system ATP-binding protein